MQPTESKRKHLSTGPPAAASALAGHDSPGRVGLVSVIIPAYNEAATVERTISSVRNQTYSDLEVQVVDDGSTDGTAAIVQRLADIDHRITLLRKPNGGLVSARNYGIAHASGEFIAPIDADDLWHPDKIKKQMTVMRDRGDQVGLVYCWSRAIDEWDRVLFDIAPCIFRGNVYTALILRNFVSSGAPLVRRRCIEELGGYDATLTSRGATCCEDLKFNLEAAERYDFDLVPECLLAHRIRAGSMSTDSDAMMRSYKVVIEEVRARHPELPARLFRWADGHQHLEFGLTYLASGQWATAVPLLLKALVEDPPAIIRQGTRRVFARLRRSSGSGALASVRRHGGTGNTVVNRNFYEVDPTILCGRPRALWSRRRLAYAAALFVEGRGDVPSGADHRKREDVGAHIRQI
jgi:glycosyltransferase involved in cell wall biosynthesis